MSIEKKKDSLESLIQKLETEELDLDEALKTYKKSMTIATELIKKLETIEGNITIIHKESTQDHEL